MTGRAEPPHLYMDAYFYTITKKNNSTKTPESGEQVGEARQIYLKRPCTLVNPVLLLEEWDSDINYCYIPDFERYYWVTDVEYTAAQMVTVSLAVDVLASYRSDILNTSGYILRSSVKRDSAIIDTFYPTKCGTTQLSNNSRWLPVGQYNWFILGVAGKNTQSGACVTGSTVYYMVSRDNMNSLIDWLFNQENYTEEITDEIVKTFFNPFQYIVDCMYYPFDFRESEGRLVNIVLGWFETDVKGYMLNASNINNPGGTVEIAIPRPINGDTKDYRNYSPYSSYNLYIPYIGMISLAPELLKHDNSIDIRSVLDVPSGTVMLEVRGLESGNMITTLEAQCCPKIALSQVSIGANIVDGVSTGVGALVSGLGDLFGFISDQNDSGTSTQRAKQKSIASGLGSIGNSIIAAGGQLSTKGVNSNMSQTLFIYNIILYCNYSEFVQMNNDDFGSPYCVDESLSSHAGGFVQLSNAHFQNFRVLDSERTLIENYLEGGVYLE